MKAIADPELSTSLLGSFREAVRVWARDMVIFWAVAVAFAFFLVLPLVHWHGEKERLATEQRALEEMQQSSQAGLAPLEKLFAQFGETGRLFDREGRDLAAGLSRRLEAFARAVEEERRRPTSDFPSDPIPGAASTHQFLPPPAVSPMESFPGSFNVQQFQPPGPASGDFVLADTFGLNRNQVRLLAQAQYGSREWNEATDLVEQVFRNEVDLLHAALTSRLATARGDLLAEAGTVLAAARPVAGEVGVVLPEAEHLFDGMGVDPGPVDYDRFRSRQGKIAAVEDEIKGLADQLDGVLAPFAQAREALVAAGSQLDAGIDALRAKTGAAQHELDRLAESFAQATAKLAEVVKPAAWLPFDVYLAARLYPLLTAGLFLFLALRLARLADHRQRLGKLLRTAGRSVVEAELALEVPGALIDPWSPAVSVGGIVRLFRRGAPLLVPILVVVSERRLTGAALPAAVLPGHGIIAAVIAVLALVIVLRASNVRRR